MKKWVIIRNIIWCLVVGGWLVGWIYLYSRIKQEDRAIAQQRAVIEQRIERQRRQAAYERRLLEEKAARGGVQNAIDGVKR